MPSFDSISPGLLLRLALALAVLAGLTASAGVSAWFWRLRRPRRFCPGPSHGLFDRMLPVTWLCANRCGYDLSAHLARRNRSFAIDRAITCPECGRRHRELRQLRRRPWQLRFIPVATLLLLTSAGVTGLHPLVRIRLIVHAPTPALLLGERVLGGHMPYRASRELLRRYRRDEVASKHEPLIIAMLVRHLGNDKHRHSAERAADDLRYRIKGAAIPALEQALASDDWQQRQFAANILRWLEAPPSTALLEVTFEGLRSDTGLPSGARIGYTPELMYRRYGLRYLIEHIDVAEPYLRRGLDSDDRMQRILCAGGLGMAGRRDMADAAAPMLIEHLKDNDIRRDGAFAMRALAGFGPAALPHLAPYLHADDDQQREAVRQLVWRFWPPALGLLPLEYRPTREFRMVGHIHDPSVRDIDDVRLPYIPPARDEAIAVAAAR